MELKWLFKITNFFKIKQLISCEARVCLIPGLISSPFYTDMEPTCY